MRNKYCVVQLAIKLSQFVLLRDLGLLTILVMHCIIEVNLHLLPLEINMDGDWKNLPRAGYVSVNF